MKDAAIVTISMILGFLIVHKLDQQSIRLLEGKLYKLGRPTKQATDAYRHHLPRLSLIQSLLGMGIMAITIILWVNNEKWLAAVSGSVSVALFCLGTWQRLRAFIAADADLSD